MKIKSKFKPSLAALFLALFLNHSGRAQSFTLYGVTEFGGAYNKGCVYKYSYPSGGQSVMLNFNDTNGSTPRGYMILANDGNLYSQTSLGGTYNLGVLFCLNPKTNKDTVLINFGGPNGATPLGGVFQASNGLIYGLTSAGGSAGKGICYSYDLSTKTQTILFSFNDSNGAKPTGHFIEATNGLLVGHTALGGTYGNGTIFYYNINTGKDSVLVNFNGAAGKQPRGLMQANNGLIYGTTYLGGDSNWGALYSYDLVSRTYSVVFSFSGKNGMYPSSDASALLQATNGLIYGIAQMGGTNNNGLLYSYNLNTGKDSILIDFSSPGVPFGENPYATGYVQIPRSGILISPIDSGGANGLGTLISYDIHTGNFVKLYDFSGVDGAYPTADLIVVENHCSFSINLPTARVAPNPSISGIITISGENFEAINQVRVYNMTGERIYNGEFKNNTQIDLSNQPKGMYLYMIVSKDGRQLAQGKFVRQ